jgi:hypothetical protein
MPQIINAIKGLQGLNRAREEKEYEPPRSSLWMSGRKDSPSTLL